VGEDIDLRAPHRAWGHLLDSVAGRLPIDSAGIKKGGEAV
jgi:hypothetical protein